MQPAYCAPLAISCRRDFKAMKRHSFFDGRLRILLALFAYLLIDPVHADPVATVAQLSAQVWRPAAPWCTDGQGKAFPSKVDANGNCDDGDAVIFNGLLCYSGENVACDAVQNAQSREAALPRRGEWFRSPRLALNPELHPSNSFSNDQNLGVLLSVVNHRSEQKYLDRLSAWTTWIEANAACIIGNEPLCLRGWPRFCRDDNEHGCGLRPGDIATLATVLHRLNLPLPQGPGGAMGQLFDAFVEAAIPITFADANTNDTDYPLHLVAVEILLWRSFGASDDTSPILDRAAAILHRRQPKNPFFAYLAGEPKNTVAQGVLQFCPDSALSVPKDKVQWTWERADGTGAEKKSMVWDCIFMANLLARP
ncbi:hypothetical protein [Caballeronia concitans]|uniref:Uncharacterized protein n=1 Tax=Caballeronia concitans TaxID=1777133 RepID=A0A658R502_9BURK|nr:hypothetical protein [Caballeronia concitans]SAL51445.1 hypothetical protein AWB72_05450 [Caballeronia concitans]